MNILIIWTIYICISIRHAGQPRHRACIEPVSKPNASTNPPNGDAKSVAPWAGLVWLAQECYLCPGEAVSLKKKQLLKPLRTTGGGGEWILGLFPRSEGVGSKVGLYDESIRLDLASHKALGPVWTAMTSGNGNDYIVWSFPS